MGGAPPPLGLPANAVSLPAPGGPELRAQVEVTEARATSLQPARRAENSISVGAAAHAPSFQKRTRNSFNPLAEKRNCLFLSDSKQECKLIANDTGRKPPPPHRRG